MVAFLEAFAPENDAVESKNRVGDFFWQSGKCVGKNELPARTSAGGKLNYGYDIASDNTYGPFGELVRETGSNIEGKRSTTVQNRF